MLETSQNYMEREVLLLLRRLHAEEGRVTRERLTVLGRGRGLDVAWSLMRLKSLGLIEVVEQRPPFWRRIFGAKPKEILRPLDLAEPLVEVSADQPLPERAALETPAPVEMQELAQPAPAIAEPVVPEIAPQPAIAPATEAPAPEAPATSPSSASTIVSAAVAARMRDHEATAPLVLTPQKPAAKLAPKPVSSPAPARTPDPLPLAPAPAQAEPSPRMPRPAPVPQGYTDELGGAPAEFNLAPRLDPQLVEGMRDFLSELGLELTFAGEALAGQRLTSGMPIGHALMDLVIFALAHAARHEELSGAFGPAEDLRDYALAVLEELERLAEAGEIERAHFEAQKQVILHLADRTAARRVLIDSLLVDPIGGAAPPALLPEELRGVEEGLSDLPSDI